MVEPVVRVRELSFGYRRPTPVIDGFSVDVFPGSTTAITGPSGRGKSTLLYLLAGLLTPWSGSVAFGDADLGRLDDEGKSALRARSFGFVFQDVVLDPRRSILDAVLEPCIYAGVDKGERRSRALDLLDRLGVELQATSLPGQISGGQAQRVGLCRALLLEPDVIFADEPTGNLDGESTAAVLAALDGAAAQGSAVLVASHDDRVIDRCPERIEL